MAVVAAVSTDEVQALVVVSGPQVVEDLHTPAKSAVCPFLADGTADEVGNVVLSNQVVRNDEHLWGHPEHHL